MRKIVRLMRALVRIPAGARKQQADPGRAPRDPSWPIGTLSNREIDSL